MSVTSLRISTHQSRLKGKLAGAEVAVICDEFTGTGQSWYSSTSLPFLLGGDFTLFS